MRGAIPWILGGMIVLVLVGVVCLYAAGKNNAAESVTRVLTLLGVLFAVVVALYGDRMRSQLNTLDLSIKKPHREDNIFNEKDGKCVYAHHLRVENRARFLSVENGRVWLVRILDVPRDRDSFTFAVGRLMQWAPLEYSPEVRSFSDDQVFDFGLTYVDEGSFRPSFYKEQGGTFHPRGDCFVNQTRRYVFEITADNYTERRQFSVDVSVHSVEPSPDWPHAYRANVEVLA
jgi:hypothetical protein